MTYNVFGGTFNTAQLCKCKKDAIHTDTATWVRCSSPRRSLGGFHAHYSSYGCVPSLNGGYSEIKQLKHLIKQNRAL